MTAATPTPEALLEHGDFLRALARRLLGDEHLAEDVVQQTYVQALVSPPEREGVRAWLVTVLHNLVHNRRRADERRAARERSAAQSSLVPSAAEIHQREALRQQVVQAVLRLAEPYRSTILLRYFEHRTPAEIARHDGVPASTVRTRLQRGHELLRRGLDDAHDGDRRAWAVIMAPCAAPLAPATTTALALPLLVMKKTAILVVALLGAALVYVALNNPSVTPDEGTAGPVAEPAVATARKEAPSIDTARQAVRDAAKADATARSDAETALPPGFAAALSGFRGRVLRHDGSPAGGCPVQVYRVAMDAVLGADGIVSAVADATPRLRAGEVRTSADGRFSLAGVRPRGLFVLRCGAGGDEQTTRVVPHTPAPGATVDLGDIVLNAATTLTGTVVGDDGAPIADAEVVAVDVPAAFLGILPFHAFDPEGAVAVRRIMADGVLTFPPWVRELWTALPIPRTRTAVDGTFRLAGVAPGQLTLAVTKPGWLGLLRPGVRVEPEKARDLGRLSLGRGEELFVKVMASDGSPVAGAEVLAGGTTGMQPIDVLSPVGATNADGELTATGFPRGMVTVAARRAPDQPWTLAEPQAVDRDVEVRLPASFTLTARLISEAGRPITAPTCRLLPRSGPGLAEMAALGVVQPLDLSQRLEIEGTTLRLRDIAAGPYTMIVDEPAHGRSVTTVNLAADTQIEIALPARRSFEVRVVDGEGRGVPHASVFASLQPTPAQPTTMPIACGTTDSEGRLPIGNLPASVLEFTASHPAFGVGAARPAGGELTTIVMATPGAIEGVVHERGAPPEVGRWMVIARPRSDGVRGALEPFPLLAQPDGDGRFRLPSLQPGRYLVHVAPALQGDVTPGAIYEFGRFSWMPDAVPPQEVEVVAGGTSDVTLDAAGPPLEETTGASIRGMLRVDGRPGRGAIAVADGEGERTPVMGKVDAQGRFTIGDVDPGERTVYIMEVEQQSMLDYQPHKLWVGKVRVPEAAAADVTIDVRTGSVAGVVQGPAGPAARAWVVLRGRIATDGGYQSDYAKSQWAVQTDAEGRFEVTAVPAGTYTAVVQPLGEGEELEGQVADIELGPGMSRADVLIVLAPRD